MIKRVCSILLVISLMIFTGCNQKTAEDFYNTAVNYMNEGDTLKAASEFVRAYQANSNMVEAYVGAIDAYTLLKIDYRIIECLELLIEYCPDDPRGYILAAELYLNNNDIDSALKYCFMQVEAIPSNIDGYKMATQIYYDSASYENALNYAMQLIELFPDDYDGYAYAIQSLNILSRNNEAIELSKNMIKVFPDEEMPYIYLSYILFEEEDYAKATDAANNCPNQTDTRIVSLKHRIEGKVEIELSDAALEVALRAYLGRKTGKLLLEDVFDITELEIVGGRNPKVVFDSEPSPLDITVESLDDLIYFESLMSLNVRYIEFESFDKIGQLSNLYMLSIDTTNLDDLSFAKDIPYLASLRVTSSKLKDISPLSSLIYLEELVLDNNEINVLCDFSDMSSLSQLSLGSNILDDISIIATASNLTMLNLADNPEIISVRALAALTSLSYLNLLGCNVKDIKYVSFVPSLLFG